MWNIDLTLIDVARVSRDAYAEAFMRATGRRLVALPQLAGASDSEIFFESLALNEGMPGEGQPQPAEVDLLASYSTELAAAFGARRDLLAEQGRMLPGAADALQAIAGLPGVIQTVLTGTIKQNAACKLRAFGLDGYLDPDVGGFGSDVYPKGTQILRSLDRANEKYQVRLMPADVVYVADSIRDVAAAKVARVRCVGVASGRSTSAELRDAGAEPVLDDLSDTRLVVAAVME
ncbi:MAG TPA: HAD family hydrolase [Streptosporangiaceae bacterium]|nr:HAD family hydrolase [Streptosporangiaceae bacterium]